jgi:hypothetical protein
VARRNRIDLRRIRQLASTSVLAFVEDVGPAAMLACAAGKVSAISSRCQLVKWSAAHSAFRQLAGSAPALHVGRKAILDPFLGGRDENESGNPA